MTAPLKIRPVSDPVEECRECKGLGSVECEDCHGRGDIDCECDACGHEHDRECEACDCECDACGHEHDRECEACDGEGRYACDVCHGFACMVAARAWEQDKVLPLIPSEVLRTLLRLAPRLDAAGLPHYSVRADGRHAQPVITVEVRRGDTDAETLLADTGVWQIAQLASLDRPTYCQWRYLGPAVRLDVKIATARGVQ